MSIHILIEKCLARRQLFRLHPYDPDTKAVRLICVSPLIMDYLQNGGVRAGQLHGDLDSFIGGDHLKICMTPHRHKKAYMGLLKPELNGLWDIRSRDPKPGMRVMGGFARKDYYIGLTYFERKTKDSPADWSTAIAECDREWIARFNNNLPITGVNPSDFLSNCTCVD